jgi:hypothetical protein
MTQARITLWIVTLTALAVSVRALFVDVVPGVFAGSVLLALLATYLLGVCNPRWEMLGDLGAHPRNATESPESTSRVCLALLPASPQSGTQLQQLATHHGVELLEVVDAHALQSPADAPNGKDPPTVVTPSTRFVVLEPPLSVVILGVFLSRPARKWLERGVSFAKQQGAVATSVLLPKRFAPSGCFSAAKRTGLDVFLASRRRYTLGAVHQTRDSELRVVLFDAFPNDPTPEQANEWFAGLVGKTNAGSG